MSSKKPQNSRRQFLKNTAKATALAYVVADPLLSVGSSLFNEQEASKTSPKKKLNILILGGTSFLGPQQIAYAMERGHTISIFTRGKTKPTVHKELFNKVESLIGDREDNLEALKNRKWDAVIDNSGHRVKWTEATADLLKDNVGLYIYTSSTGVYYPYLGEDIKEDTKLLTKEPEVMKEEEELEYWYGVMKTNSESAARKAFGEDRTIAVRPTYMMGPGDKTDRFTYWPIRLKKGGEILVPGKPDDPVQYIDVRDVAQWMIRLIESGTTGSFNAVGPPSITGMMQFVYGAHAAFSSEAEFVSVPDYGFLLEHKVPYAVPWIMPKGKNFGSSRISNYWGVKNGLTYTPLAQSCADIIDWWDSDALTEERRQKLEGDPESLLNREAEILKYWKNRG